MTQESGFPQNAWESHFRTARLSDLTSDAEGVRFLTVKSRALGRRADMCLWSPPMEQNASPIPLVVLLHGVYGSAWTWAFGGGAHRTTATMIEKGMIPPMALVMPSDGLWGDGSGYCPHVGADYERWIVEEVPLAVREVLPSVDETSPCFLAGLSMGGYGALRLGAKFAERWRGISAHSAITDLEQMSLFVEEPLDFYQPQNAAERSVLYWLQKNRDRLPPLRFDCGRDDLLIEPNRQLHTALQESGIAHEYTEFEGTHHWDYWREHLRDTLGFFGEIARATPVSA